MYVSVIVNNPSSNVDRIFEYKVPTYLEEFIYVGSRIKIPFGNSDRLIHGFIIDIHENRNFDGELKEIDDIPDLKPVINEEQFKIAEYLKETTFSPMVRILNSMIPTALKMKTSKYLYLKDLEDLDADIVSLFNGTDTIKYSPFVSKYAYKIKKAISNDKLEIVYDALDNNRQKFVDVYTLNKQDLESKILTIKKDNIKEIVSNLKEKVNYEKKDLQNLGLTDYTISSLVRRYILNKDKMQKSRIIERAYHINDDYYKTYASKEALKFNDYYQRYQGNEPILWIPKTDLEIIQGISLVISSNISKDLNTLIIVPDILSSFKFADLIKRFLGIPVLCINSNIHDGESLDGYNSICNNEYKVIVTTPVGVLWPYQKLGSIFVIDEESENYYNDQSPRFDVKEVAKFRNNYHNSKLTMVSYTPDLDLFSKGIQNKIKLVDNAGYLTNKPLLSEISVINMRDELKEGNISPLSTELQSSIKEMINNQKASLLILNNKGYSDFVLCRACGHVEKCEKCNISLKYHEKTNRLYCPACGKFKPFIKKCSNCSSSIIKFMGLGAEKLKEVIESEIPNAKCIIIDEPKYSRFKEQVRMINDLEANVIISTDTYSRGLTNTNIGLVGIMSLDLVLKSPGFKANQKAYSMLYHAQKILEKDHVNNKMIIQTYDKDHFVLKAFVTNNYLDYFKQELTYRNLLQAPPFFMINRIVVKGKYEEIFKTAYDIMKFLKEKLGGNVIVIGPVYNYTEAGAQLIIKHQYLDINKVYQTIYDMYQETALTVIIDCYPRSIL